MNLIQKTVVFCAGGSAYVAAELLWRGRSHYSMFLAGGLCILLIGHLEEVEPRLPLPLRCLAGAGIITAVELAAGLLVNRSHTVWDYRHLPGNFLGQICIFFSLLWIPMAWAAELLYCRLRSRLTAKVPPAG